ncbi:MAG: hypothetical protein HRU20_24690 [Pseudomonadales bacterium]|nr:hypothetical protein [Pseudomonadales bacterium]
MNQQFRKLAELGAGDFDHIDGNLIDHLQGTQRLLSEWSASSVLLDAGLYHAAYGTAGFDESLVSTEQRDRISQIIGSDAEALVYLYCACDRDYFWPQFAVTANPEFKNRFTDQRLYLSAPQLRDFCELTVANEIEIAMDNPPFIKEHGESLYSTFVTMRQHLSEPANTAVQSVLGSCIA